MKSSVTVPLAVGGSDIGVLVFSALGIYRNWQENFVKGLCLVGTIFANAIARKSSEESLYNALIEIKKLKEQLESDYT